MILLSVKFEFVLTQPLIFCSNLGQILTSFCAFTRLSEKSFNTIQDKGKFLFVPGVNFIVEKVSFYNMITTDFLRNKHDLKLHTKCKS